MILFLEWGLSELRCSGCILRILLAAES